MAKPVARRAPAKTAVARPAGQVARKKPSARKPVAAETAVAAGRPAAVPQPAAKTRAKMALKLVRDGFTMPQQDFDLIAVLKKRAIVLHRPAKKSELLRAALHVLNRLPDESLLAALEGLVQVKLGRPKKGS